MARLAAATRSGLGLGAAAFGSAGQARAERPAAGRTVAAASGDGHCDEAATGQGGVAQEAAPTQRRRGIARELVDELVDGRGEKRQGIGWWLRMSRCSRSRPPAGSDPGPEARALCHTTVRPARRCYPSAWRPRSTTNAALSQSTLSRRWTRRRAPSRSPRSRRRPAAHRRARLRPGGRPVRGPRDRRRIRRDRRFITVGITTEQRALIGPPPTGHGLLGLIIREGRSYRIPDIAAHPGSYGFPPHHPPMRSLLGVPVTVEGRAMGYLYLTDKEGPVGSAPGTSAWSSSLRDTLASPSRTPAFTTRSCGWRSWKSAIGSVRTCTTGSSRGCTRSLVARGCRGTGDGGPGRRQGPGRPGDRRRPCLDPRHPQLHPRSPAGPPRTVRPVGGLAAFADELG